MKLKLASGDSAGVVTAYKLFCTFSLLIFYKILFLVEFDNFFYWNNTGVIRVKQNPDGLCSIFVQPYYSRYDCHKYSVILIIINSSIAFIQISCNNSLIPWFSLCFVLGFRFSGLRLLQFTTADGFWLGVQRIIPCSDLGQKGLVFLNIGVLSASVPCNYFLLLALFLLLRAQFMIWEMHGRVEIPGCWICLINLVNFLHSF